MTDQLDRQLDWAEQQSRHTRTQMARTATADQQLAACLNAIDHQLRELSQDWLTAKETQPVTTERFQAVESYQRFLMEQKTHVQVQRQQLATQLAAHRAEVLQCEQRLRLLQRRNQRRQQRNQRRQEKSHAQLLDRYSHQCVLQNMLSHEDYPASHGPQKITSDWP